MSNIAAGLTSQAESDLVQNLEDKQEEHKSSLAGVSASSKWKWMYNKQKAASPQNRLRSAVQVALQKSRDQKQGGAMNGGCASSGKQQEPTVKGIWESLQDENGESAPTERRRSRRRSIYQGLTTELQAETAKTELSMSLLNLQSLEVDLEEEDDTPSQSMSESTFFSNEEIPLLSGQPAPRRRRWSRGLYREVRLAKRIAWKLMKLSLHTLLSAYCVYLSIPLFLLAWMLSTYCHNPTLHFLPQMQQSVSWWLHLFGRQLLTLDAARALEWIVVDCLAQRTPAIRTAMGPLAALLTISSKGWPFLVSVWAFVDLCILHGDHPFVIKWIFEWTDLASYTASDDGGVGLLNTHEYLRLLYCMMLTGILVSIKRCWVTVRVGRRIYADFKPRFEQLLQDICLLGEVAELGREIDRVSTEGDFQTNEDGSIRASVTELAPKHAPLGNKVGNVWFGLPSTSDDEEEDGTASLDGDLDNNDSLNGGAFAFSGRDSSVRSGPLHIKVLLERWKEPSNKEQRDDATVKEILKFESAIHIMGQKCPFGGAFGDASTRDQSILSSLVVHKNLLKLTPNETDVPYETLLLLMQESDHGELVHKKAALRRLFRPDRNNMVTELAFVSSCDAVYRKLRYFHASVANAVVLDSLIMRFFDIFLGIILLLAILAILRFNPWPVLLSMSTVFLSFSFAMGKAVSEYVDGVVLIAIRRPYDLGDRIVLSETSSSVKMDLSQSWFVEDIDLYTTTLRFARTNEVCTVPNGSLSNSRIVNCNRSAGASMDFGIMLKLDFIHKNGGMLEEYVSRVRKYIEEHPRIWDSIIYYNIESIDTDAECVCVRIGVRHRNSWQTLPTINRDKGYLNAHMYEIGREMGMIFLSSPTIRLNYDAGNLKNGKRLGYRSDLFAADNVWNEKKEA